MGIGLMVSPKVSLRRYWSPESEPYAPASALLYFLDNGWEILSIEVEALFYSSGRYSTIYHFQLAREGVPLHMPVVSSPAVSRLIAHYEWSATKTQESSRTESIA